MMHTHIAWPTEEKWNDLLPLPDCSNLIGLDAEWAQKDDNLHPENSFMWLHFSQSHLYDYTEMITVYLSVSEITGRYSAV